MKILLLILSCYITTAQTELIGKYQIDDDFFNDILQLNEDHTYEYISQFGSFPTQNYIGVWHIYENNLILSEYGLHRLKSIIYKEDIKPGLNNNVVFNTLDDKKYNNVSGVLIKYTTVANGVQVGETNNKGTVIFEKSHLIDSKNDRINIEIEYFVDSVKFYKTTSINQKSNYITLFISQHVATTETRLYKFSIEKGAIKSINAPGINGYYVFNKL